MQPQAAYDELLRRSRELTLLDSCATLLGWDEETYLPPQGTAHRSDQLALLTGLYHTQATDPRLGDLLAAVEGSSLVRDPYSAAAVNVREIRREFDREARLPRALVEELARVTTLAQQKWQDARRTADFKPFRTWLEKVVRLKRQEAEAVGYKSEPYDALLDEHEPGSRAADLVPLFDALRQDLVPLVNTLAHAPRRADVSILHRTYPLDWQQSFGKQVAAAVGFDFGSGRLDTTVHPFCSAIGPGDCRLATRYSLHNFSDGFFGILHEVGHGLYEQGLDPEHHGTPMGDVPSVSLHESQARFWENTVGRSISFWEHFLPQARIAFPDALNGVPLDAFYFAVNQVEPSFIRATADEVTYNLHILVRFELERALINGDLNAADVPGAWNEHYRHYLGITPPDDAQGCLQDGHWASGLFGYFPTYTLGNLFAAQLYARAESDLTELSAQLAKGQFTNLLGWLRANVHRQGHRYPAARLIEKATGAPPAPRCFIQGLRRKYGQLYGIA